MTWSIQVEGISKLYRLGRGHRPRFDNVSEIVTDKVLAVAEKLTGGRSAKLLPARTPPRPVEIQSEHLVLAQSQFDGAPEAHFWALKDISFRVDEGQRIGIIGRNGSGKSTLLKILSRITSPSEGQFQFRGRLISLLEIGTGFHPDLTGRENIHMNAKINGLTDRHIRAVFDDIVEFSELGVQIDMPIKRYSSGMYMRLAFSVAAHLDSEILVVDEVLAVGDTGFQRKCQDKMLAIGNSGRTLLFVSHDMDAVRKICSSALELSHGRIVAQQSIRHDDPAASARADVKPGTGLQSVSIAIADYSLARGIRSKRSWEGKDAPKTPSGRIALLGARLETEQGAPAESFHAGEPMRLRFDLMRAPGVIACTIRLDVAAVSGRLIASSLGTVPFDESANVLATQSIACLIPAPFFNTGVFRVSVLFTDYSDDKDRCAVADALDIVVTEPPEKPRAPGLAPDAPLAPAFVWSREP